MSDIPSNWPEIAIVVLTVVGWLFTLERRLSGKQDKAKYDHDVEARRRESDKVREAERERVDDLFQKCFERMERNQTESLRFREEIRDGLNDIKVQFAKISTRSQ